MKNSSLYFDKLTNISIVATFFALWIAVFFNDLVEDALAYVSILTFGMLHGANDLKLIQKSGSGTGRDRHFWFYLSLYVAVVLLGLGLFYLFPALAFVLFIVVSAYHFGEQHWSSKFRSITFLVRCFFLMYGLLVLSLLFCIHYEMVVNVVEKITGHTSTLYLYRTLFWASGGVFVVLYLWFYFKGRLQTQLLKQLFFIVVFFVVFKTASLLWSFAIYFILWHSLPSIADQIVFLYGNLNKHSFLRYVKSSFVYWLIAALGAGLLLFLLKDDLETSLSFFLAFLAAITFPHVLVISRLHHH